MRLSDLPRRFIAAAALGLALTAPCVGPARAEGSIERSAVFVRRVNESIDRGVEWLRARQFANGSFGEYGGYPASQTAIAYLTLRTCGVDRDSEEMESAVESMRAEYVRARDDDPLRTYSAALIMMAIEQHGHRTRSARDDDRYGNQDERTTKLDAADQTWMRELVEFMEGNQNAVGTWRYGQRVGRYGRPRLNPADYDPSNTQYALLGLKSASRSGVKVDADVYLKALKHLVDAQQRDGPRTPRVAFGPKGTTLASASDRARGWGYTSLEGSGTRGTRRPGMGGAYGSMTAGSLGAIVICRSELLGGPGYTRKFDGEVEEAIWDGIAWLGRYFAVEENPGRNGWHYYYLYALERAGVLAGVDWMSDHDWYGEGADYLIRQQMEDGRWRDAGPDVISTCFALLFLKKGTIPVARGAVTPSGGASSIDFSAAVGLTGKGLEDFVDLVIARWRKGTSEGAREELRRGLASVGEPVFLPLLTRMATGGDDERAAAHWFASGITGVKLAFDPAAATEARFDALMAWEEWYMARSGKLRFDSSNGKLVVGE